MKLLKIITIIILLAGLFCESSISLAAKEPQYKVCVIINGKKQYMNKIRSFVTRDLREIGDVTLVNRDQDPQWIISIIYVSIHRGNEAQDSGIAMSVMILPTFNEQGHTLAFPIKGGPAADKLRIMNLSNLYHTPGEWIRVCPQGELRAECEDIVADFDVKYLEETRKSYKRIKEMMDKQKNDSGGISESPDKIGETTHHNGYDD